LRQLGAGADRARHAGTAEPHWGWHVHIELLAGQTINPIMHDQLPKNESDDVLTLTVMARLKRLDWLAGAPGFEPQI
jgi:hypothetical protein